MSSNQELKDNFVILNEDYQHNSTIDDQFIIDERLSELVEFAEKEQNNKNNIPQTKPKNCSIELVRILAGFFVIIHHIIFHGYRNRRKFSIPEILFLNNIGITCNSLFISISAFFLCDSRFSVMRIFRFWVVTVINLFYAFYLLNKQNISPITNEDKYYCLFWFYHTNNIWYSSSHLVFIFLMPFISKFSERIGKRAHFLLVLFLIYASSIAKSNRNDSRFNPNYNVVLFFVVSVLMSYYKNYLYKKSILWGFPLLLFLLKFQIKVNRKEFVIDPNKNYIIKATFNGFFSSHVSSPCQILMAFCIFHILSHIQVPSFLYYPLTFIGKTVYGSYILGDNAKFRKHVYNIININNYIKPNYIVKPVLFWAGKLYIHFIFYSGLLNIPLDLLIFDRDYFKKFSKYIDNFFN